MHLLAIMVDLSLHATMKYVTSSSTSRNVPFYKNASAENPSSTRSAADVTKRYVTGEEKRILGVMS